MAIDTRNKRASALREGLLPLPDGLAFDEGDRQEILWQYRGIIAGPPIVTTGGNNHQFIGELQQFGESMIIDASTGVI